MADTNQILVNIKINPQTDAAERALNNVAQSAQRVGKNITSSWDRIGSKVSKGTKDMGDSTNKVFNSIQQKVSGFERIASKVFSPIGITGLGLIGLTHTAHDFNQKIVGWHNSFRLLSNATGDTSKAVSTMQRVWGKSAGSLDQISGAMSSLSARGLPTANKNFEQMATWVTNLSVATGISADTFADFTVGLNQMYDVSLKSTADMTSALIALGDGFGFTNTQIEEVMKSTSESLKKIGMFFDNVDSSMKSMTVGIGGATAAMKKMGVSVQTAGNFFQAVLDPEKINENMNLFSRLGISYEETMDMMTAEGGQETFLNKLMQNMPALARQITSLKNPMARLQFSKSLGLPLEIAQKMAKGTAAEIQSLMKDYKLKAQDQAAAEKKQARMKADQARFDEALMFIKMKAMMPIMQFVNRHYNDFFKIANQLGGLFEAAAKFMVPFADKILPEIVGVASAFINTLTNIFTGKGLFESIKLGFSDALANAPVLTKILTVLGIGYGVKKVAGAITFGKDLWNAFRGKPGESESRPMFVQIVKRGATAAASGTTKMLKGAFDIFGSKFLGPFKNIAGKIPGLGKIADKIGGVASKIPGLGKIAGIAGKIGGIAGKIPIGGILKGVGAGMKTVPGLGTAITLATGVLGGIKGWGSTATNLGKEKKDITWRDRAKGGLAGAASALSFGAFDTKDLTQLWAGSNEQKEAVKAKWKSEDEAKEITGGITGRKALTNIGQGFKKGGIHGASMALAGVYGDVVKGQLGKMAYGTKGFVDAGQLKQQAADEKTLADMKAGKIKATALEIKAMQSQVTYNQEHNKKVFNANDMARKRELEKNLAAHAAKGTMNSAAAQKELDELNKLNEKKAKSTIGWGDIIAGAIARIGKFFGMEGVLPEIKVKIKNQFEALGAYIVEMFAGMKDSIMNFFSPDSLSDAEDKWLTNLRSKTKYETKVVNGKTMMDMTYSADMFNEVEKLKNDKAYRESQNLSMDTVYLAEKRQQDYFRTLTKMQANWDAEAENIADAQRKQKAEDDKNAAANAKKTQGMLGAINGNVAKVVDNTEPKKAVASQDYINFWMKNQGFMAVTHRG